MAEKIFLIHGMLDTPAKFSGVRKFLQEKGYTNIIDIKYSSYELNLDKITRKVFMDIIINLENIDDPIILLCHSMGGIVATKLWKYGLNIKLGIFVASPLQGVPLVNNLCTKLGKRFVSYFIGHSGSELGNIETLYVPFKYYTVSTNLPYFKNDGIVNTESMKIRNHTNYHIPNSTHDMIMFDCRLYEFVDQKIRECYVCEIELTELT